MKLPPTVLQSLLHADVEPAVPELASARFPLRLRGEMAVLKADHNLGNRSACAVLDISQMGVALGCSSAVASGTTFVLWMKDSDLKDVAIECQAVQSTREAQNAALHIIAARFVQLHQESANSATEDQTIAAIRAAMFG